MVTKMMTKMGLALVLVMGCSAVTVTPAATPRGPVSGDEAREGDLCDTDRAIGARCTIETERCDRGGFSPARYVCAGDRWTCRLDRSETCPINTVMMPNPDCRDREYLGTCRYGTCDDGTALNGRNTCIAGQAYCLPDPSARCPTPAVEVDAGTTDASTTDAGAPDSGTSDAGVITSHVMSVRYDGPVSGPVYAGSNDARFQRTTLLAERDLEIGPLRLRIEVVGDTGFLSDSTGGTFLWDVKLINEGTGRVLSGPIDLRPGPNARTMYIYMDRFTISAGEELRLALTADVPYRLDPSLPGTRFRVVVDGGNGHFFPDGAVRTSEGAIVSPEAITDNVVIPGNEFTLRRPSLTLNLTSDPRSHTTTKRAINVPSAGVALTADPGSDIHLTRLRLRGVGDVGYGLRTGDFHNVVTSCNLIDGNLLVASNRVPDSAGYLDFVGLDLTVRRGTTQHLHVLCVTDSVLGTRVGGDLYAIGMMESADVTAEDSVGTSPGITVQPALPQQLTNEPLVVVTVVPSGTLSLRSEVPTQREYNGGSSAWQPVGYYNPTSTIEHVSIDRFALRIAGNSACVAQIGLARSTGEPFATNIVPSGFTSVVDLVPTTPFVATPSGSDLIIVARFNPTGADPSACLSGSVVNFSLAVGLTTGEWDENFRANYNARAVGMTSGERVYVAMPAPIRASAVIVH